MIQRAFDTFRRLFASVFVSENILAGECLQRTIRPYAEPYRPGFELQIRFDPLERRFHLSLTWQTQAPEFQRSTMILEEADLVLRGSDDGYLHRLLDCLTERLVLSSFTSRPLFRWEDERKLLSDVQTAVRTEFALRGYLTDRGARLRAIEESLITAILSGAVEAPPGFSSFAQTEAAPAGPPLTLEDLQQFRGPVEYNTNLIQPSVDLGDIRPGRIWRRTQNPMTEYNQAILDGLVNGRAMMPTIRPRRAPQTCAACQAAELEVWFTSTRDGRTLCQTCFDGQADKGLAKEAGQPAKAKTKTRHPLDAWMEP